MVVTAENLHDDKGPKILAVLWTLTGLTTVMVTARVYIRLKLLRNFGMDDYLIVASMVSNFELCLLCLDLIGASVLDIGACILRNLYSRRGCGLWKTCQVLDYGQPGDGHSAQYSQLSVWDSFLHSSQDCCDVHVDPDLEPQANA
jgi:hypothetical protein